MPGGSLTRDEILDHLWGGDYAAESNVVDRQVRKLRAKLQDDWRRPSYIATVPGQGYRFVLAAADERDQHDEMSHDTWRSSSIRSGMDGGLAVAVCPNPLRDSVRSNRL